MRILFILIHNMGEFKKIEGRGVLLSRKVARGGLLCDYPGKTITVLLLNLQIFGLLSLSSEDDYKMVNVHERGQHFQDECHTCCYKVNELTWRFATLKMTSRKLLLLSIIILITSKRGTLVFGSKCCILIWTDYAR